MGLPFATTASGTPLGKVCLYFWPSVNSVYSVNNVNSVYIVFTLAGWLHPGPLVASGPRPGPLGEFVMVCDGCLVWCFWFLFFGLLGGGGLVWCPSLVEGFGLGVLGGVWGCSWYLVVLWWLFSLVFWLFGGWVAAVEVLCFLFVVGLVSF